MSSMKDPTYWSSVPGSISTTWRVSFLFFIIQSLNRCQLLSVFLTVLGFRLDDTYSRKSLFDVCWQTRARMLADSGAGLGVSVGVVCAVSGWVKTWSGGHTPFAPATEWRGLFRGGACGMMLTSSVGGAASGSRVLSDPETVHDF